MDVRELTQDERQVLFGLLAYVAAADGEVGEGELRELELLGDELGVEALSTALADARNVYPTRERLLDAVGTVRRRDARELMRTLLIDLATADGDRGHEENALLSEVTRIWARG
jgi:uncharacterized tellurite resistance protein B-like protein